MSDLQRCRHILTDLHARISHLEREQAGSSVTTNPPLTRTVTGADAGPSVAQSDTGTAAAEHQRVFGYIPRGDPRGGRRRRSQSRGQQPPAKRKAKPTWTRLFVCLANMADNKMPSPVYYRELKKASLGEKSLTFNVEDNALDFDLKLKREFPKLDTAGGYSLMCTHTTTRTLEDISPPYTVQRLKRETGQCKIFIRPLQTDLDLSPDDLAKEAEVQIIVIWMYKVANLKSI